MALEVYVLVVEAYGAALLNLLCFNHQGLVERMLPVGDVGVQSLPTWLPDMDLNYSLLGSLK